MASNDIRDVLDLPADGSGPRPAKKQKVAAPRPNLRGLAREVQNLGGDMPPVMLTTQASHYKKRRFKPAAKWEQGAFKNSAREDSSLILRHWRKVGATLGQTNGDTTAAAQGDNANGGTGEEQKEPEMEDTRFAKYNVKINIPEYTDEQYAASLQSDEWTKDETDYLMETVKNFDLRWPIIWDRYEYSPRKPGDVEMNGASTAVVAASKPRTMEDLKARYYKVAAVMMEVNKPKPYMDTNEYALHQTMLNFNPASERARKDIAIAMMNRSKEEAKEEESLLIEAKRIMARAEETYRERLLLYDRLDYPPVDADKIKQYQDSVGLQNLQNILMNQNNAARKKKALTGPEGASPTGNGPHAQPSSAISEAAPSRRESIAAQSAGHRESISGEKSALGSANKKGQPPAERRVLSEYEKQIYGVSQHERLSSGPTYRYERVNKLFAHKSNSQQLRIQGVLNVLGIPLRLHIATATVVAEYEKLVANVTSVVEMRKHKDKLLSEIKIEEAKKAERAKAKQAHGQLDGTAGDADDEKKDNKEAPLAAEASEDNPAATNGDAAAKSSETADPKEANVLTPGEASGDVQPENAAATQANGNGDAADGEAADQPTPLVKQEEGTSTRPGSSSGPGNRTKRSASVLSGTSDKSAKRQKK